MTSPALARTNTSGNHDSTLEVQGTKPGMVKMIKLTYPLIATYYGKHLQTIKMKGAKLKAMDSITNMYKLLRYYESKK